MKLVVALICCCLSATPAAPQGCREKASVTLETWAERVLLLEVEGGGEPGSCRLVCTTTDMPITLTATARAFRGSELTYSYTVTGGKIVGEGAEVGWDLTGLKAGDYTVSVKVSDRRGASATDTKKVKVEVCVCVRESLPPWWFVFDRGPCLTTACSGARTRRLSNSCNGAARPLMPGVMPLT